MPAAYTQDQIAHLRQEAGRGRLLTVAELAAIKGCHPATILRRVPEIPHVRLLRTGPLRFNLAAVERWERGEPQETMAADPATMFQVLRRLEA